MEFGSAGSDRHIRRASFAFMVRRLSGMLDEPCTLRYSQD